jgi:hypothetical protein
VRSGVWVEKEDNRVGRVHRTTKVKKAEGDVSGEHVEGNSGGRLGGQ